jgi:hypothetical protein
MAAQLPRLEPVPFERPALRVDQNAFMRAYLARSGQQVPPNPQELSQRFLNFTQEDHRNRLEQLQRLQQRERNGQGNHHTRNSRNTQHSNLGNTTSRRSRNRSRNRSRSRSSSRSPSRGGGCGCAGNNTKRVVMTGGSCGMGSCPVQLGGKRSKKSRKVKRSSSKSKKSKRTRRH